jgi:hypothetical protein
MVDTLKIAEDLRAGDTFTPEQATRIAKAVAQAQDDKRLKDVEVRLGVLTWITGLQLALLLAVLWQVVGINTTAARLDVRLAAVEARIGSR